MNKKENLNPNSPEVLEWAKNLGQPKVETKYENIGTDIEGTNLRVVEGTDVSNLDKEAIGEIESLAREVIWTDQITKVRVPEVKKAFNKMAEETGVRGVTSDPDHGNYSVLAVPRRKIIFDNERLIESLGDDAIKAVDTHTKISLDFDGDVETDDGKVSGDSLYLTLRHALLGRGISEDFVESSLLKSVTEKWNEQELARNILEGKKVDGISFEVEWSTYPRAVEDHLPIKVRRPPVRKNLIRKRN